MPRHRSRRALGPECLEPRRLLAVDMEPLGVMLVAPDPDEAADPTLVFVTSVPVIDAAPPPVFSAGFAVSDATTPWISAASTGTTGAVVFWLRMTVLDGVTSTQIAPIWGRLNPVPEAGVATPPGSAAELVAAIDGLVFGGPGSPLDAATPLPFGDLAGFTPPLMDGVQEYFLVARSESDFALTALACALLLSSQSDALAAGEPDAATGSGPGGTELEPGAEAMPAPVAWLLRLRSERPFGPAGDPAAAFPAGAGSPAWLVDAQQGGTGVLVLWVTERMNAGAPSFTALPLWVRFNPQDVVDPGLTWLEPNAPAHASSSVAYLGDGSAGPIPLDGLEAVAGPSADGVRSAFVVTRSGSNIEIALTLALVVIVQAPDWVMAEADGMLPGDGGAFDSEGAPAWTTFLRDLAAASVPAPTVHLVRDTGLDAEDRITRDGRLRVDAQPGCRAEYSRDGGTTWRRSFRARPGVNSVLVRQVERGGRASPATSFEFTLDRSRPRAPRITAAGVGEGTAAVLATPRGDLAVSQVEPGARLEYSVNRGPWSGSFVPASGRSVVRVRQIDVAGNVSRPQLLSVGAAPASGASTASTGRATTTLWWRVLGAADGGHGRAGGPAAAGSAARPGRRAC